MITEEKILNENNVGKWDSWYKNLPDNPSEFRYGQTETYQLASEFLKDCDVVEDWGCDSYTHPQTKLSSCNQPLYKA